MNDSASQLLTNLVKVHREIEEKDFEKIWKEGIFVFDSNVLLDLYRLPESASKDLLKVLKNKDFTDRIWIGFQVMVEFLNNRHEAISDQKNKFEEVRKHLAHSMSQYHETFSTLTNSLKGLKLKQRHSLIDPDKYINEQKINSGVEFIEEFIEHLNSLEKKQSDVNDKDTIKSIVLSLFEGKIGQGFTKSELEKHYEAGEKRYVNSIPPGYKDKAKTGSYLVDEREFIRKFGDLILWHEITRKAKAESLKYIVLVTGDVKEDWWYEKRGKKLGPRKELLNEIYHAAPELEFFHMYDTSNFLLRARDAFSINVQESSIKEAKNLIENSRTDSSSNDVGAISLQQLLLKISGHFSNANLKMTAAFQRVPPLTCNENLLYDAFFEFFSICLTYGKGSSIIAGAGTQNGQLTVRIQNKLPDEPAYDLLRSGENDEMFSSNLSRIRLSLTKEGITSTVKYAAQKFLVDVTFSSEKLLKQITTLAEDV
ncbi:MULTISPECIES: PIN-like domain-containing protein [unclassified Pseudomonas]|uniref:PIN-like domain-containing protein n=1 Tax=unclassified Pseudomonas TaxID=196821 RepID=UPI00289308A6|nr:MULTISPECIES: PIN-like domain-containing protein [unclassified Pseudomonas]